MRGPATTAAGPVERRCRAARTRPRNPNHSHNNWRDLWGPFILSAQSLGVVVGGFNTSLDSYHSSSGLGTYAANLCDQLNCKAPGATSAVIAWNGYDAPNSGGILDTVSVGFDDRAKSGGRALTRFVNSLSNYGIGPDRTTLIGHSYGSKAVFQALRSGLDVDAAVFVGSPGLSNYMESPGDVTSALADVSGRTHLFSGCAQGDSIPGLLPFNPCDPGTAALGITRFGAGRGDHSSYFQLQSASIQNIQRIINGDYDAVTAP